MAGTESSGFEASFKELFEGAKWVLTPSDNVSSEDIQKAVEIIEKTGAKTITASAKEHDEAVSLISHMPLILSQALFYTAKNNNLALKLASSGFRDMTRLALSNLEMAEDMRKYNGDNIKTSAAKLINSLEFLEKAENSDIYADIKNMRSKMYSKDGKNIF